MKVALIIRHAPDYRESFFRQLGEVVDLTVVAQPCEAAGLTPPNQRTGYKYVELPVVKMLGLSWQPGLIRLIKKQCWTIICCGLNLRELSQLGLFFVERRRWSRWVWRGHVFGSSGSRTVSIVKRYALQKSAGCLAYSEEIANRVSALFSVEAISFNNTEVSRKEFRSGVFDPQRNIRLLFVGRNQRRKRLDRLVQLVRRRQDVLIRLVGPGMERLCIPPEVRERMEMFERAFGEELIPHFDWADLVVSPGHVGLLVMNAARHGKGIVIDRDSVHAPEYRLACEANQPFISFGNDAQVDEFFAKLQKNRKLARYWGRELQSVAKKKYTVEAMVAAHLKAFQSVSSRQEQAISSELRNGG